LRVVTFVLINPSRLLQNETVLNLPIGCNELIVFDSNARWIAQQSEARWSNSDSDRVFLKHLPDNRFDDDLKVAMGTLSQQRSEFVLFATDGDALLAKANVKNPSTVETRDIGETNEFTYSPRGSTAKRNPELAILLIHIENYELTQNCLESLSQTTFAGKQIYLLENASCNFSALKLFLNHESSIMLFSTARTSYCSSFNILADFAIRDGAKYLFVSNNDTRNHSKRIFETLISKLSDSMVMVSPSIFDFNGNLLRSNSVTHFGIPFNLATEAYVTTAAHWRAVDGFTTAFNIYCEDVDLLMRTNRMGLDGCYAAGVSLEHLQNGATRKKVFLRTFFYLRNVVWLQKRKSAYRLRNIIYFGLQEAVAMMSWAFKQVKEGDLYPLLVTPWFLCAGLVVGVLASPKSNSKSQLVRALKRPKWELKYMIR